ncbi:MULTISPECIES: barstar family protein [Streptomyces]|uniref:Barstar (barnase inhibitor) domain-containing protein n=2 Tax=Streptomyces TaxID=1883 RepID=A0A100YAN6_9ACTN|nr:MULTISPECIES: barstar family protein [Streptomyces]KUH40741.1 hypothetical protein ATE80_00725 [Streptomyces kanasensis]UUS29409.1 barstar family protein [Streptomyces changanensis]
MNLEPGVTSVRTRDVGRIVEAAEAEDCPLYQFSTEDHRGARAFFDAVRHTLPLDPPVVGSGSWDALSDSLWEGIHTLHRRRVALLWRDATAFRDGSPEDFRIAVAVLADVVETLADPTATVGRPTDVCVYIAADDD